MPAGAAQRGAPVAFCNYGRSHVWLLLVLVCAVLHPLQCLVQYSTVWLYWVRGCLLLNLFDCVQPSQAAGVCSAHPSVEVELECTTDRPAVHSTTVCCCSSQLVSACLSTFVLCPARAQWWLPTGQGRRWRSPLFQASMLSPSSGQSVRLGFLLISFVVLLHGVLLDRKSPNPMCWFCVWPAAGV